ncbi:MAG: hypothetical protein M3Z04_24150 [Chloroflexota bacterium]|nr:hypothetical protein [Chloroflexota bacterium]
MIRSPATPDEATAEFDAWFWGDPAPALASTPPLVDPPRDHPPTCATEPVVLEAVTAASADPADDSSVLSADLHWNAEPYSLTRDSATGEAGANSAIFDNDPVWEAATDSPLFTSDSDWQAAEPAGADLREPTAAMLSTLAEDAIDYGIEEIDEEFANLFELELDPLLAAQLLRCKQPIYESVPQHRFEDILDHAVASAIKRFNLEEEVEGNDLLRLYLRDIYRIPLLKPFEELTLAQAIAEGRAANKQLEELGYRSPVPDWADSASSSTVHVSTFGPRDDGPIPVITALPLTTVHAVSDPVLESVAPAKGYQRQSRVLKKTETTVLAETGINQINAAQKTAFHALVKKALGELRETVDQFLSNYLKQRDFCIFTPSQIRTIEQTRDQVTKFYEGLNSNEREMVRSNHLYGRLMRVLSKLEAVVQEQERKRAASKKPQSASQSPKSPPHRVKKKMKPA